MSWVLGLESIFEFMQNITDIIRQNKLYTVLLVFIIAVNLLLFMANRIEKAELQQEQAIEEVREEETVLFDEENIEARKERIEALAEEDPLLYFFLGVFNLTLFLVILTGIVLDGYFFSRWLRRRPLDIRIQDPPGARWGIADVARVALIFLSFGYAFVILQAFAAKQFPILYNENFRMVFNTALINLVGISVIFYFIIKKYGQGVDTIGLTLKKAGSGVTFAAIGYIALIPVLMAIMVATFHVTKLLGYKPPVQPIVEVFIKEKEVSVLWISALFAAVFGPVAEEIFFRGFMYTAVRKKLGVFAAMMSTSVIFSFLHTHIVGFAPIVVLGLLLAYLYEKTGSLIPSITVHILHNMGMLSLVFLVRSIG